MVQALIETHRQHIGKLKLSFAAGVEVRVWLDGVELPKERLGAAFAVVSGSHRILHASSGCAPQDQLAQVPAGGELGVELGAPQTCQKPVGQLQIRCSVPGVRVELAEAVFLPAPTSPVLLPVGPHSVRFKRDGYRESLRQIIIEANRLQTIDCGVEPLRPLPPAFAGALTVHATPDDALVLVDGAVFDGSPLPLGVHQLRVERAGFREHRSIVSLQRGKPTILDITLNSTAERQLDEVARQTRRKRAGFALGGVGLAFLGGAGGLYAWNSKRYSEWGDAAPQDSPAERVAHISSVQRVDDLAIGLAVLGTAGIASAAWLLLGP